MADAPQPLTVSSHKDIAVVEFTNNKILDETVLEEIRGRLAGLVEAATPPKLLLDFAHVDYMSSAALGMLINVNKSVREKNGQLRLVRDQAADLRGLRHHPARQGVQDGQDPRRGRRQLHLRTETDFALRRRGAVG